MADSCCLCLDDFTEAGNSRPSVVCKNLHSVCHECFPKLYATVPGYYGGGLCPSCRDPLLIIDEDHPYVDTLPIEFRVRVMDARAAEDARFAQRLQERLNHEDEAENGFAGGGEAAAAPAAAGAAAPGKRKKRTNAEYDSDLRDLSATDPAAYRQGFAKRMFMKARSARTGRAWRRKRVLVEHGRAVETDYGYQYLRKVSQEWNRRNKFPKKAFFNAATSLDVFLMNFAAEQANNAAHERAIMREVDVQKRAGHLNFNTDI